MQVTPSMGRRVVPTDDAIAVDVVVHGRVQGVFFRANTKDRARLRGVCGWVRNELDGTVRAHLEGRREDVEAVIEWIEAGGPPRATVESVERSEVARVGHIEFEVR